MDSDNVLQRHRARFEAHRQWLKEQQELLSTDANGGLLHTPASARSNTPSGTSGRNGVTSQSVDGKQKSNSSNTQGNGGGGYPTEGARAPAYSQAQRTQRTAAAAEWVEQTVHQQSREPLSRDRDNNYHSTSSWPQAQQQSIPTTARSYEGSARLQIPSSRSNPSYDNEHAPIREQDPHHYDQYAAQNEGEDGQNSQHASIMYFEGSPLHVYSRSTQWAKRRQQKLLEMRDAVDSKELADCTFKPDTSKIRASSGAPSRLQGSYQPTQMSGIENTSYSTHDYSMASAAASVSGWEEFMCRRLRAKQLQDEKKTRLRSDGSGWTGAPTVVEEFSLGVAVPGRKLQKVLKQPVAAPHGGTRAAMGATIMMPPQGGFSQHGGLNASQATSVNNGNRLINNSSSIYGSPSPVPRAADVPTETERTLPPKGLFSLRGSSTFVEGLANGGINGSVEGGPVLA